MQLTYKQQIWKQAVSDAESAVMRATATPPGGRKGGEDLLAYVERTRQIQDAAIARWRISNVELEAVSTSPQSLTELPVSECADNDSPWLICKTCTASGKCAKEQAQPVAEVVEDHFSKQVVGIGKWASLPNGTKLYTTPPAPQSLTDEDIVAAIEAAGHNLAFRSYEHDIEAGRAVEAEMLKRMGVQR